MSNLPPSSLRGAIDLSSLAGRSAAPAPGATPGAPAQPGAEGDVMRVPSLVVQVDEQQFAGLVELSTVVPIIVDLRSARAPQSAELSAILEKLVREYDGRLLLAAVDAEQSPRLLQAFQAQGLPTVGAVVAGQPLQLFAGLAPEEELRPLFEQLLELAARNGVAGRVVADDAGEAPAAEPEPEPLPPLHQEAYDAIEQGDYPVAIAAYEKAIKQNPGDQDAVAGLAQVRLLDRLAGKALPDIRGAAAADPTDVDAQLLVADLDLSGGHVEDAFDRLLQLFPTLDADGKTAVRLRMVEYFEIVGAEDPRVGVARRRLTNLLF